MSLVSIIIPHFNRSELLRETVRSVASQSVPNWELIIVDDGSCSSEFSQLRRLETDNIRVLQRVDGLKGPSRCRNLGTLSAAGEFVLFLDSDDLLAPWCLEQRLLATSRVSAFETPVFPVALFNCRPGDMADLWNDLSGTDDLLRFVQSDPVWHTSGPLWRRSQLLSLGGFDERVMYGDDSHLHLKALLAGMSFRKVLEHPADVFVRRSDHDRITRRVTSQLIASRRTRLSAGTELLRSRADPDLQILWQTEYLAECEFLIFNAPGQEAACSDVLNDWKFAWPETRLAQMVVSSYVWLAWRDRGRRKLLLRMARRLARLISPRFFAARQDSRRRHMTADELERIRNLLRNSVSASPADGRF